jgi:Ca-activated chloride channel family protein
MIKLENIALRRGPRLLFEDVSLGINAGQKLGLTGANGCGKSSLFKLFLGELQADQGDCRIASDWVIAHVAQEMPANDQSAIDYVIDGDVELRELQSRLEHAEREQQGIEIMVALDISQSMMAEDIKPNRLSRAKLDITDLMQKVEGNEIGLVLFSGDSFIQFPLTFDIATARNFLDNAHTGMISRPGTDIGDAIETAIRGFNDRLATQKVIVINTDGENHEPNAVEAARKAAENGIIIYTIGIGSPTGEPIPRYNDVDVLVGFKKDQNGETILSRLDEVTLQQLALETGGRYFRSTPSGREIDALVADLNDIEKSELEGRFETRRIERFQIFLFIGLLALVTKELIPDRKRNA